MRKFILNIFLVTVPIVLFVFLFEILLRNIPNDYSYKKTYLDKKSNKIEKLFLGSSHAYYGVNPSFIMGESFNASHISQSINYDYEILKKFKNSWNELKYIIIPIDYFTFLSRIELGQEAWRIKNYNIYYNFNTTLNILDNSEFFNFRIKTNLKRIYGYYFKKQTKITCTTLGYGGAGNGKKKDLTVSGKTAAKRHTKKTFDFYDENLAILNSILNFSAERNIKVLFYTTPAFNTYVSNLNEEQLKMTINSIISLVKEHDNCMYVNLLEDDSFKAEDFRDADHLNPRGAEKLSIKLDSLINVLGNENYR